MAAGKATIQHNGAELWPVTGKQIQIRPAFFRNPRTLQLQRLDELQVVSNSCELAKEWQWQGKIYLCATKMLRTWSGNEPMKVTLLTREWQLQKAVSRLIESNFDRGLSR